MNLKKIIKRMEKQGRVKTQARAPVITLPQTWELPMPPSTNKLWSNVVIDGQSRRVLTKVARAYIKDVTRRVAGTAPPDALFVLTIEPHDNFFTKAGAPRQADVTNRVKILEDAIAKALGYDDCRNWRVVLQKQHSTGRKMVRATLDTFTP